MIKLWSIRVVGRDGVKFWVTPQATGGPTFFLSSGEVRPTSFHVD